MADANFIPRERAWHPGRVWAHAGRGRERGPRFLIGSAIIGQQAIVTVNHRTDAARAAGGSAHLVSSWMWSDCVTWGPREEVALADVGTAHSPSSCTVKPSDTSRG